MKEIPAFTPDYISKGRGELEEALTLMLEEDDAHGDATSAFTPDKKVKAEVIAKDDGFISGMHALQILYETCGIEYTAQKEDGKHVGKDDTIFTLRGDAQKILKAERTSLNILSRMSGITTLTRKYVEALKASGSDAKVAATRKTTPLFRYFEKKAVAAGGGVPHRMNLSDMILIKDNHLKVFGGVKEALEAAAEVSPGVPVEIEVCSPRDALAAAEHGADVVMLDNMTPAQVGETVAALSDAGLRGGVVVEVSGGVNLDNIAEYGRHDVDVISAGSLTSAARPLNVSLEFTEVLD